VVEPCPVDGSDPLVNYQAIRDELVLYDETLGVRPEIVVVSKSELPGAEEVRAALAATLGRDVLLVSSATGTGLDGLIHTIASALDAREATV
jgi:GTP-binding protein